MGGTDDTGGEAVTEPDSRESDEDLVDEHGLIGTVLAERFEIQSVLGKGGMGAVYLAQHVHMKKPVAIKVLHPSVTMFKDAVARFEREAVAAGRIEHPHVAAAMDFGRLEDGSFYLVLEFVQGRSLADELTGGAFDQVRAIDVARQVAAALDAAHNAGIVHRDLKPENVMLVERGDYRDFVKVLDFGIAKIASAGTGETPKPLTQAGEVFGTPLYMSPEQASGKPVDHRTDIYALGILLYEMLAGKAPFYDEDVGKVITMQIQKLPPPLPAELDPDLVELVMDLLAKVPAARVQTALELFERLSDLSLRHGGRATKEPKGSHPSYTAFEPASRAGREPAPSGELLPSDLLESIHVSQPEITPAGTASGAELTPQRGPEDSVSVVRAPEPSIIQSPSGSRTLVTAFVVVILVGASLAAGIWIGTRGKERDERSQTVATATATNTSSAAPTDEVAALMARAATGDPKAIEALEKRPAEQRTAAEWFALGRGRMETERYASALKAYEKALDGDAALAKDRTLLSHVRDAADIDDTAETALQIAAYRLGSAGADILYEVWVATKAKTTTTQMARQLVYAKDVRANASPALDVMLKLREAETCEEYKKLMPDATLHGDTRALRVLKPLTVKTGCGDRQLHDCWECLREDDALKDALAAVRTRQQPVY